MKTLFIGIGGLGGSGTRIIAEILKQSGIFIGDILNGANDNLLYSHLFNDIDWYKNSNTAEIESKLLFFEKLMKNEKLNYSEKILFLKTARALDLPKSKTIKMILSNAFCSQRQKWAWKEPNSHVFLKNMLEYYSDFKYIFIIRNGFAMGTSSNKRQLMNWGWKYKIDLEHCSNTNARQVAFWAEVTKSILFLKKQYERRVLIVNYESLCKNPHSTITDIHAFCEIKHDLSLINELSKIPVYKPYSKSRIDAIKSLNLSKDLVDFVKNNSKSCTELHALI